MDEDSPAPAALSFYRTLSSAATVGFFRPQALSPPSSSAATDAKCGSCAESFGKAIHLCGGHDRLSLRRVLSFVASLVGNVDTAPWAPPKPSKVEEWPLRHASTLADKELERVLGFI